MLFQTNNIHRQSDQRVPPNILKFIAFNLNSDLKFPSTYVTVQFSCVLISHKMHQIDIFLVHFQGPRRGFEKSYGLYSFQTVSD